MFQEARYELHGRVTELGFLDPNLVVRKLWMNESRKLVRRPQLRQVHRSHIPSQARNTGKRSNGLLSIEALCESTAREGCKS